MISDNSIMLIVEEVIPKKYPEMAKVFLDSTENAGFKFLSIMIKSFPAPLIFVKKIFCI